MVHREKNRKMEGYLSQLEKKSFPRGDKKFLFARGYIVQLLNFLNSAFICRNECVFLSILLDSLKPEYSPSEFYDLTAYECFVNHIHMIDFITTREPNMLALLDMGLVIGDLLSMRLSTSFPDDNFVVIISYNEIDCNVRFHKVRENQPWLAKDLNSYELEGILVIST